MKKFEVPNLQKIFNACDKVGIKASAQWNNSMSPAPQINLNDARTELTIVNGPNLKDKYKLVAISPKHKQIVITIQEDAGPRTSYKELGPALSKKATTRTLTQAELARVYKTNTPEGTTFEYKMGQTNVKDGKVTHFIHITALIPGALQYFLIGYDEKHLFVCQLPEAVKSVEEAHRNLIPLECRGKKYLRQGEYFFLPVSEKQLKEYFTSDKYHHNNQIESLEDANGDESDHDVSMGVALRRHYGRKITPRFEDINLVCGEISNPRHKSLWLPTVHRVFISRERPSIGTNWD